MNIFYFNLLTRIFIFCHIEIDNSYFECIAYHIRTTVTTSIQIITNTSLGRYDLLNICNQRHRNKKIHDILKEFRDS